LGRRYVRRQRRAEDKGEQWFRWKIKGTRIEQKIRIRRVSSKFRWKRSKGRQEKSKR
jgi:hypothetical protein